MNDLPRFGPGREFERIRAILENDGGRAATWDASSEVQVGPGDDAAVLAGGLVLSTDLAVEGVHFRFDWMSPREVGYRVAAGGVSDLAAMAAAPVGILVSIAVPDDESRLEDIMRGVTSLARDVGARILGGDLTRSPAHHMVDVVSVGRCDRPLLRSGAVIGDELWVTGTLGGAAAAVHALSRGRSTPEGLLRYLVAPTPRLSEARWLLKAGARAGIDLSDGLAGDAGHIAAASGVGVVLDARTIPISPEIEADRSDALRFALHGGDDYELLVAAAPGSIGPRVTEFTERFEVALTRVGEVTEGRAIAMKHSDSGEIVPLVEGGYDHFADRRA